MAQTKQPVIDVKVHRRVLGFLNAARRPEDLMVPPQKETTLIDERIMHVYEEVMHVEDLREEDVKDNTLLTGSWQSTFSKKERKIVQIMVFYIKSTISPHVQKGKMQ